MRRLAFAVLVLLVSACATCPPPKIEGNRYQNYRHGFTLELPGEPWVVTDKPPAWFKSAGIAADHPTSTTKLLLFNKYKNAFIAVHCTRSQLDFDHWAREAIYSSLSKEFERQKKESLKLEEVTLFDYNVSAQGGYVSGEPLAWTVEIDFETPIQRNRSIALGNAYPIGDDTHFIQITLLSDQLTFDENYEVFDKMYKSFEWSDLLTKSAAE